MKMLASEYIGGKIIPSATNPLGDLILTEAPPGVADFALALRKIDAAFTHKMVSGGYEDIPMFTQVETYLQWYAMALGEQHPEYTITLFGEAEAEDFENAFTDPETLEDYITIAQESARATQVERSNKLREQR